MTKIIFVAVAAGLLYWMYTVDEQRITQPGYGQESAFMRCAKIADYRANLNCERAAGIENIGKEIVCDREPSNSICKER